jgi:dimethylargininase
MLLAMTRPVSDSLASCQLTHLVRSPIDLERARVQHAGVEAALTSVGATVVQVPGDPSLPDAVFVEDTAVVLDEIAMLTRPGALSRRPETVAVGHLLSRYRRMLSLREPATLDGGDVLPIGRTLYVGRSTRTNAEGIAQLRAGVGQHGYDVQPVDFVASLHLKSAVTRIGEHRVLVNPEWVEPGVFRGLDLLEIDPEEPGAANALLVDGAVIYPSHFPGTRRRMERAGIRVIPVETSELAKAEGGVTCCALVFRSLFTVPSTQ